MSHTTTLKGIAIKDTTAIEQAVADLQAKGVSISLLRDTTPRMYFREQEREIGVCEYVLKLPGRYDVGLKWDAEKQEYTAYMDTWGGDVRNAIGAACPLPSTDRDREGEHAIGAFTQRYGVNAAKNQAAAQGYMVTERAAEDGTIHLEVQL